MSKKKTLIIGLSVIVVCLLIAGIGMIVNRSQSREATAEEIAAHVPYAVDWTQVSGWQEGMSEQEFILSMCSYEGQTEVGDNVYDSYSSDTLAGFLYRCNELSDIMALNGILYITYYPEGEDMVILGYDDSGLCEKAVYDGETDTMFHELDGTATVWTKFRNGVQWGA